MGFKMDLKINLGNYQNVTLGIDEQESFEDCQKAFHEIIREYMKNGLEISKSVLISVGMDEII